MLNAQGSGLRTKRSRVQKLVRARKSFKYFFVCFSVVEPMKCPSKHLLYLFMNKREKIIAEMENICEQIPVTNQETGR